jgi:hypothetical protein
LSVNQTELVTHLEAPNQSEDAAIELIRNVGPYRNDAPEFFTEFYRLLHNYLASVKTLVDHSRSFAGEFLKGNVHDEYQAWVGRIAEDPMAKFVQELRHVVLHDELPQLISDLTWTAEDGPRHELWLKRETLLLNSRWTAPARTYIKGQPPEFAIRKAIDDYQDEVLALSVWIDRRFRALHGKEVDDYHRLLNEFLGIADTARSTGPQAAGH